MKKLLFIFALVVSLVLPGAGSVVYAMDYPEEFPSAPNLVYGQDYKYWLIFESLDGSVMGLYIFNVDNSTLDSINATLVDIDSILISSDKSFVSRSYSLNNNAWVMGEQSIVTTGSFSFDFNKILYSDYNVFNEDGSLFFPLTPVILKIPEETLIQILTQENPLKEILILLPMVIVCWAGFVGLWKALAILVRILRKA